MRLQVRYLQDTTVLVVGKGFDAYRQYTLEELHQADIPVWLVDDEPADYELGLFQEHFQVNFDTSPTAEANRLNDTHSDWSKFRGVCYIEGLIPWAAEFMQSLGIPFMSTHSAATLRSKSAQRTLFTNARIPSPEQTHGTPDDLLNQTHQFPLVIKPESGYSSIGVELITDSKHLSNYFERRNNVHSDEFVVESVIDGNEYSIEGYADGNSIEPFAKTIKFKTPLPFFEEIGQYCDRRITPSDSDAELLARVLDSIGIHDGVFHLEVIDSQGTLVPVEIGGRLAGDKIPYLHRRISGRSLMLEYLGVDHTFQHIDDNGIGIVFFVPSAPGTISSYFPSTNLLQALGEHYIETNAGASVQVAPEDFFVRLGFSVVPSRNIDDFISKGNALITRFEDETGVPLHRLHLNPQYSRSL